MRKNVNHNNSKFCLEELKLPAKYDDLIKCSNTSEYACISLLEKYTDWKAITGVTFQIPIGRCTFDFFICDKLIEYHPISLKREFFSDELSSIKTNLRKLNRQSQVEVLKSLCKEFELQYKKRREQIASAHPKYSSYEVLCVHNSQDFIKKVIIPNSNIGNLNLDVLSKEFDSIKLKYQIRH